MVMCGLAPGEVSPLETVDRRQTHLRNQVRIFAVGLFDAAPARIPRHVDHRRQRLARTPGADLPGHHAVDLLHQLRVPGAGQSDGLGKDRCTSRLEAVESFFVEHYRDSQASLFHVPALYGVHQLHRFASRSVRVDARLAPLPVVRRSRDVADSVGNRLGGLLGHEDAVVVEQQILVAPQALELRDLLFEGHLREQVGQAKDDRLGGVFVQRHRLATVLGRGRPG